MKIKKFLSLQTPINHLQLDILENGILYGDQSWNFPNITSPFNRLYFIMEGEAYVENEHHKVVLKPGNVYLLPKKTTYSYRCDERFDKLYLHFNLNFLPGTDVFEKLGECICMPYPVEWTQKLMSLLENSSLPALLRYRAEVEQILAHFMSKASQDFGMNWGYDVYGKYIKLFEMIQRNLTAEIKISELAKTLNYSYYSLSKSFKQDVGIGLNCYIENMLATKAKQLLLTTDLSIGEIAADLRFCDQYYFSRFFKKHANLPPREYRERNKIINNNKITGGS